MILKPPGIDGTDPVNVPSGKQTVKVASREQTVPILLMRKRKNEILASESKLRSAR